MLRFVILALGCVPRKPVHKLPKIGIGFAVVDCLSCGFLLHLVASFFSPNNIQVLMLETIAEPAIHLF
jgi:hypothetical protein